VMHLMIDIGIIIGIFSYAIFVLYLAWVPPGTVKRLPDTFKHATTKLLVRLHRGRSDPTTRPRPSRSSGVATRRAGQYFRSLQRRARRERIPAPAADVDGHFTRTSQGICSRMPALRSHARLDRLLYVTGCLFWPLLGTLLLEGFFS
jgi:uncharacterized protein (DUF3084 family)